MSFCPFFRLPFVIGPVTLKSISSVKSIWNPFRERIPFYYASLWLITSVGSWLVQIIPIFCGLELRTDQCTCAEVCRFKGHTEKTAINIKKKKFLNVCSQSSLGFFSARLFFRMRMNIQSTYSHTQPHTHSLTVTSVFDLTCHSWVACLMSKNTLKLDVNNQAHHVHQHHISRPLRLVL